MKTLYLFITNLLATSLVAFGQCDAPSPQQNAAYEKVVNELQRQFRNNLPAGNWQIFDERHSLGKLQLSDEYGKLFRVCGDRYDLTLERAEAARERRAQIDSAVAQADPNRQEKSLVISTDSVYRESGPAGTKVAQQNTVDINVEMNAGNYRLEEPISNRFVQNYKVISVKGAPLALQITLKPDENGIQPRPETVVLLGNWKNKLNADARSGKFYRYSYAKGGTLIENLVVTIKGPFDVANDIVRKVDWATLANTLTK